MSGPRDEGEMYRRFLEGDGKRFPPFSKESYSAFLTWMVKEGSAPQIQTQTVIYTPPAKPLEMPRLESHGSGFSKVLKSTATSMGIYALIGLLCFLLITAPPERPGDSLVLNAQFEPPSSMEDRIEQLAQPEPTPPKPTVIPDEPPMEAVTTPLPMQPPEPEPEPMEEFPPVPQEPETSEPPAPAPEPPSPTPTPPSTSTPAPPPSRQELLDTLLKLPKGTLSHRFNPDLKRQLRTENGGSDEAELAVDLSLQWLAEHQDLSGCWRPGAFQTRCAELRHHSCGGQGTHLDIFDEAVTALCLLAFLGDGHRPKDGGIYDANLALARQWLLSKQKQNGSFGPPQGAVAYATAIAALALHELSAAGEDEEAEVAYKKALDFLADAQESCGGWDYTPAKRNRGDVSITGWCFLGLQSTIDGGSDDYILPVLNTVNFIRDQMSGKGWVRYDTNPLSKETLGCTAIGLLLEQMHFVHARSDIRKALTKTILQNTPVWEDTRTDSNTPYYWYIATMALYHQGGDAWMQWYPTMEKFLLENQERSGNARGSFRTMHTGIAQGISQTGGRIVHTAFNTLTLETTWRYVPLRFLRKDKVERMFPASQDGLEALVRDESCDRGWKLRAMGKLYGKSLNPQTLLALERLLDNPDDALKLEAARHLSQWEHAGARDTYIRHIGKYPKDLRSLSAAQELSRNFSSDPGVSKAIWTLARLQERDALTLQLLNYLSRTRDSSLAEEVSEWAATAHNVEVRSAALKASKALAGGS
ncbi:MAG: prenyltransferase/squalene oxidase repeat-containing protein [Planctomycetota bacterium]